MVTKAVFLGKSVLYFNHNLSYDIDLSQNRLVSGAKNGLWLLQELGYKFIIVSNQPGIARGRFPEIAMGTVERQLSQQLEAINVQLEGFYYCPHDLEGINAPYAINCSCRKPKPGMLFKAAHYHNVDLSASWFIGSLLDDVEAGRRAGCETILVETGRETLWNLTTLRRPHYIAPNFFAACEVITTSHTFNPTRLLQEIRAEQGEPV